LVSFDRAEIQLQKISMNKVLEDEGKKIGKKNEKLKRIVKSIS